MTEHQVWVEGYDITGGHGDAWYLGEYGQETFDLAVEEAIRHHKHWYPEQAKYWKGQGRNATIWGCRVFDNEAEARKSFG